MRWAVLIVLALIIAGVATYRGLTRTGTVAPSANQTERESAGATTVEQDDSGHSRSPVNAEEATDRTASDAGAALPELLRFRVVDTGGAVLTGAHVEISAGDAAPQDATTGEDGSCEFQLRLDRANPSFLVTASGYLHVRGRCNWPAVTEVVLERCGEVLGRVVRADGGYPVPEARVTVPHRTCVGCAPDAYVSDSKGEFTIPCASLDIPTVIYIEDDGHPAECFTIGIDGRSATERLSFELVGGIHITGIVIDRESGAPIPGAVVAGSNGTDYRVLTDQFGRFAGEFVAVPGDRYVQIEASFPGYCRLQLRLANVPTVESETTIALLRGCIIRGTLTDASGAGMPDAVIAFVTHDRELDVQRSQRLPPFDLYEPDQILLPESDHGRVRTDTAGAFCSPAVLPWVKTVTAVVYCGDGTREFDVSSGAPGEIVVTKLYCGKQ